MSIYLYLKTGLVPRRTYVPLDKSLPLGIGSPQYPYRDRGVEMEAGVIIGALIFFFIIVPTLFPKTHKKVSDKVNEWSEGER